VKVRQERGKTTLVLEGAWTVANAGALEQEVLTLAPRLQKTSVEVQAEKIAELDTSGAFFLKKILPEKKGARLNETQRELLDFLPDASDYASPKETGASRVRALFVRVGSATVASREFLWDIFVFVGRIAACFAANFLHPRHFRLPAVVRHVQDTGLKALPIIGLLAVLISMVLVYQGANQLQRFGAAIFTIDLTVISLLREMGVLVTAIMMAGRSGSAYAAEIGVMTLREEVNALRTMGLNPIEILVLPRVIALMITLPLLTFLADLIGILGAGVMSLSLLDVSFKQYLDRVQDIATFNTFFVGMIKAPVFAFAIAVIGCYQGLHVTGSAESIGRRTTLAVVQAIFVVIMADALFSVVFSEAGI
jgi:phospholipid/cholesterol/gamma-HCH transport system permease protein